MIALTRFRPALPLLLIVAVAATVRLATLGRWSVWTDEAFTLNDAHSVLPSYPLGYLLVRWSVALLGTSEWAIRIVPCLFGIATLVLLGWPAGDRHRTARYRWAALLLALSSWHVFWSQSARYYAPLVFFMVGAARALDGWRPRTPGCHLRLAIAALGLGAAMLCHPSSAFYLPGALLLALTKLSGRGRLVLVGITAVGGIVAVWHYGHLFEIHRRFKDSTSTVQLVTSYGFQAGPLLLLGAAWGVFAGVRGRGLQPLAFAICFSVVPGVVFLLASRVLFVTGYHAVATLPFVAVLAAFGVLALRGRGRWVGMGCLIAEQVVGLGMYHASHGMRPDYRSAASVVSAQPANVVYASQEAPLAYYLVADRRQLREPAAIRFFDDYLMNDLVDATDDLGSAWLVLHSDDLAAWSTQDLARLESICRGAEEVLLPGHFGPKSLDLRLLRITR